MTEERLVLAELLEKAGDGDFLRAVAEAVLQLLMESDVEGMIGAGRYERSGERTTWRNGYRDRTLDTRLGALQLRIPKLRQGSYFPPFLEARKSSEKALIAVIQEAWISGVSTRRVDDLVQAMGLSGISKSQVSKLCKDIDERVHAFLDRPLAGEWPYLWLDATYLKQREGGRIVSVAAIIAVAANTDGRRVAAALRQAFLQPDRAQASKCCGMSPTSCRRSGQSSPPSPTTARPMCCPIWISPNNTAANYTAPTRSSGSTKRSNAAPTSSASFPFWPPSFG